MQVLLNAHLGTHLRPKMQVELCEQVLVSLALWYCLEAAAQLEPPGTVCYTILVPKSIGKLSPCLQYV